MLEGGRQGPLRMNPRRRPTLPRRCQRSTIGPGGLNFRVRDGNGCGPSGNATGNSRGGDAAAEYGDSGVLPSAASRTFQGWLRNNRGQAARAISTGQLNALRRLHLRPINLVIYEGPSEGLRPGRSHLQAGFALRCLQRLSLPDIATERCSWRNSSHTRGPSTPVLVLGAAPVKPPSPATDRDR